MVVINPEDIGKILVECAESYIVPRYKALEDHEISTKTGPNDMVTQADLDVEDHLMRVLPDLLLGSIVIGEEGVSQGISNLDVLKDHSQAVWVVDPVDGTKNFVQHNDNFGVMLALVIDGQTQYGWVYDVIAQRMHIAERGAGGTMNGERMCVRSVSDIGQMIAHINYGYFPKPLRGDIKEAITQFKSGLSVGSAAHEYTRIATGQADISLYSRLKPWDHLPGSLMVEEAGGYIGKWDKSPYTVEDIHAGLIVATSKESWENVFELIFGKCNLSKYL